MTTAEFAKYDIIIIGEPSGGAGPTATELLAAYETRATWGAAVTGRIMVTGQDPAYHVPLSTGAGTFMKATFSWLATSAPKTTSLYVAPDWATRKLDFMSPFGAFSSGGSTFMNTITITDSTHPTMTGSTSASLSTWNSSAHNTISFPATFTSIANGADSFGSETSVPGPVTVVRDGPTCGG